MAERGEIWSVDFEPQLGSETNDIRPALLIGESGKGSLPLRIVVPLTDWKEGYSENAAFTRFEPTSANGLSKTSGADAYQIRSISTERLKRRLGVATPDQVRDVVMSVALCIGWSVADCYELEEETDEDAF